MNFTWKIPESQLRALFELVSIQTRSPQGCDPKFIEELEQSRMSMMKMLNEEKHWTDDFRPRGMK